MNDIEERERLIARIADGEASFQEENRFIVDCEIEPDSYRLLALELLERRRLMKALQITTNAPPTTAKRWVIASRTLAVVAASIAIGFAIGYQTPGGNLAKQESQIVEPPVTFAELPSSPFQNENKSDPPLETLVSYAQKSQPEPVFDENAISEIRANGIEVKRYNRVFLVELSGGQRLAIPAEFTLLSSESE